MRCPAYQPLRPPPQESKQQLCHEMFAVPELRPLKSI